MPAPPLFEKIIMVRKGPKDTRRRAEPAVRQASDPDRDAGDADTTVAPGEERKPPRSRQEPEPDDDVE
jgi:hypothetical protein